MKRRAMKGWLLLFPVLLRGQAIHTNTFETTAGRAVAPVDITGEWVSIITEDWRHRMLTPEKGDYNGVPINEAAKRAADQWDPGRDEAAGEQCRAYGAAAMLRVPGRIRISWQDDETLKLEMDNGQQTRLFHFGAWKPAGGAPSWQGESMARWNWPGQTAMMDARGALGLQAFGAGAIGAGEFGAVGPPNPPKPTNGSMSALTRNLRPGYLRKNGIPYSADTTVTDHFDLIKRPNGDEWLMITTIVDDPKYLEAPFITSAHFRKHRSGASGWKPEACSAR